MTEKVPGLSAVVITKNEAGNIDRCLSALTFCEEIVIVDSGSSDDTVERARAHGARIVDHPFESYGAQREFARTVGRSPWLLTVDADEVVTPALADEVARVLQSGPRFVAFEVPFKNYFRGEWIRRAGYYPDRHIRLFQKASCRYDASRPVHERLVCDGPVGRLRAHVEHHTFGSVGRFVEKSARYAEHWALAAHARGRRAGTSAIFLHTVGRFFRAYFIQLGFLDGTTGLVMSGLQAAEVFQKYVRLWELSRFGPAKVQSNE
ncbi:MAG: glycosyltransferase family 2 protein [Deltaproteobacteria bacterium]|nr:glycosyltransferase family 2 protein [Deltaproteobacteria bacterium]